MFVARETPWAGIGTLVKEAPTSEAALKLAGMDWDVIQKPLLHNDEPTGWNINIRQDVDKVLGVVGGRYKPVQNVDAFNFMDSLLGMGVTYESAGCINGGRRVWMMAKFPEISILDDKIDPYICLSNFHDSFGSLKIFMTPVRIACQNMVNLAMSKASRTWSVRHTGSIDSKLATAKKTFGLANTYLEALELEAKELVKVKIAPKNYEALVEKLFPITPEMTARKEESQIILRSQLDTAWQQDDLGNIRGTGWGFMNAVSDMTTHREPARRTDNYRENAFMTAMDAPVILDQAYKLVKEFGKAS